MKITKQRLKQIIKEELESILAEAPADTKVHKGKVGDKLTAIVNAWGGYRAALAREDESKPETTTGRKEAQGNLIKVLKSFKVPKELALKIVHAEKQEKVKSLVTGKPAEPETATKPVEKGKDNCARAKAEMEKAMRIGQGALVRKAQKLIDKYCGE